MFLEGGVIELDLEVHLEAVVWIEARPLVAVFDLQALENAREALGSLLLLDARRLQEEHKGPCAAVHDGDFTGAHLDQGIVDAQPRQGGQEMLDGGHLDITFVQGRAHHGVADILGMRLDVDCVVQVRAAEDDAGVRQRRPQGHQDLLPRVQPHARGTDRILERSLIQHLVKPEYIIMTKVPQGSCRPEPEVSTTLSGWASHDISLHSLMPTPRLRSCRRRVPNRRPRRIQSPRAPKPGMYCPILVLCARAPRPCGAIAPRSPLLLRASPRVHPWPPAR